MAETNSKAPVYRYFTADLLSNKILAEIPFQGVTYERAIKGAGRFSGSIGVNEQNDPLDLYNSTMPGNTALFVVRDGLCVWGGIIWSRDYDIVSRTLQVSGNEFTSYFYHRRIWKTWTHEYGAFLEVDANGLGTLTLDLPSTEPLKIGSSIYITFSSASDLRYDNYYTVGNTITPTTKTFTLDSVSTTTNITSISRSNGTATFVTDGYHHLVAGDLVNISVDLYSDFSGTYAVGSIIESANNLFTVQMSGANVSSVDVTGTVSRPIPAGAYYSLTVTTSTDTYDYIRRLIDAVMNDFSGVTLPNDVLQPGITYSLDITEKEISDGYATITTSTPHNLAEGQSVTIKNVDSVLNGDYSVYRTPTPTTFTFAKSGELAPTTVAVKTADIVAVLGSGSYKGADGNTVNGELTMTTSSQHQFLVGDWVDVVTPLGYQYGTKVSNGTFKITKVTSNTFSYVNTSGQAIPYTPFTVATATVGASSFNVVNAYIIDNSATLVTAKPHTFQATNSVTVVGASPFNQVKSRSINYDPQIAINDVSITSITRSGTTVTVTTGTEHGLSQYETITISGTSNSALNIEATVASVINDTQFTYTTPTSGPISALTAGTVKKYPLASLTALQPHYLQPGDTIEVKNVGEAVPVTHVTYPAPPTPKSVTTSSQTRYTVTLVFATNHGFEVGNYITVTGSSRSTFNGTHLVTAVSHTDTSTTDFSVSYAITTEATIASASDTGASVSKKISATVTTGTPHKLKSGSAIEFSGLDDTYVVTKCAMDEGVATLTFSTNHNLSTDDSIVVSDLYEKLTTTAKKLSAGEVTLTVGSTNGLAVNDSVSISGLSETYYVKQKARAKNKVTLTTTTNHNIKVGDVIKPDGINNDDYLGPKGQRQEKTVIAVTANTVTYEYNTNSTRKDRSFAAASSNTPSDATIKKVDSEIFNGDKTLSRVSGNTISYIVGTTNSLNNIKDTPDTTGKVTFESKLNGTYTVTSSPAVTDTTLSYVIPDSAVTFAEKDALKADDNVDTPSPSVSGPSPLQKVTDATVSSITGDYEFTVNLAGYTVKSREKSLVKGGFVLTSMGVFNGTHKVVSVATDDPNTLSYSASRDVNGISVKGQAVNNYAYFKSVDLFNVTGKSISSVVSVDNSFSFAKSHSNVPTYTIAGQGYSEVRPTAVTSTSGGFPGNSDIGMLYSVGGYSGVNVKPTLYRGFELASVGEALDKYSDSIDGFEYRIDCEFDEETQQFNKIFVLIPINFPDPPAPGELSPLSRFGADEFIFEYPGNIANVSIAESAENSSTRFFALGTNDAGANEGANYSAASDTQLLTRDSFGRKWPLLDDDEKIDNTDDKTVLYSYAKKYMSEARPPDAKITLAVNGSLEPKVGTYVPGDWCAIVIDDRFVRARLATDLEPRNNVLVRKIESYSVVVPDSVTFPEKVTLNVVPEWEVDKRG